MNIILLGPPGAGKGTQAKALAQRLKSLHISTGDLLRHNVSQHTSLGEAAKSYMEKGALVPDELVTDMLKERLALTDTKNGFILDGYPRTISQAKALNEILRKLKLSIDGVMYLDTSKPVIVQRLTGRRVCKSCGVNFHIKNMPPKNDGICDFCGAHLYQRNDDKEETIEKRLQVYQQEVSSLIDFYAQQKKLLRVTADDEAEVVLDRMISLLKHDSLKV